MRQSLSIVLMLAAPRAALACPVCFGQSNSPMAHGTNMGIYFLLAVTGGVLTAFASFFIYLMRRARLVEEDRHPADAGLVRAQEGSAQC